MFEYDLYPIFTFIVLLSLNDASVDIADDEGSFEFSPKVEVTSPLHVHITFATDTEVHLHASHNCPSVKTC